mgnify:CR=1 FL=1
MRKIFIFFFVTFVNSSMIKEIIEAIWSNKKVKKARGKGATLLTGKGCSKRCSRDWNERVSMYERVRWFLRIHTNPSKV